MNNVLRSPNLWAGFALTTALLAIMVSCSGPTPAPVLVTQAPAVVAPAAGQPIVQAAPPVVYQQAPVVAQSHSDGLLTGMMLGHMLSAGGGGSSRTTIVNKTTVVRPSVISRPSYSYRSSSYGRRR